MRRIVIRSAILVVLLMGALASSATARIQAGNTGWSWSNPLPQGNSLKVAAVAGDRIWSGGAAGTLVWSDDAGRTWGAVRTGLLADIRTIDAISPNSLVFASACALRRTDDGGTTVRRLPWSTSDDSCSIQIQAVSFPTPLIGYLLLTSGEVYTTGDGGMNWRRQGMVPCTIQFNPVSDMHFTQPGVGVAGCDGHIFQTSDAAQTWTEVKATGGTGLRFAFTNQNVGLAVGVQAGIFRTSDGGATWTAIGDGAASGAQWWITSVECAEVAPTNCLATLADSGMVLRSVDGGASWAPVEVTTTRVRAVGFIGLTAVAVGDDGFVASSGDAGASWQQTNVGAVGAYNGLSVVSRRTQLLFGSHGAVARTQNGGDSWETLAPAGDAPVLDAAGAGGRVFALGGDNRLRHTEDGQAWRTVRLAPKGVRGVHAFSRTRVVLIGSRGVSLSMRAGRGAKRARGSVARLKLEHTDPAGKLLFAYGPRGIAMTTDKGRTWKRGALPKGSGRIVALDMVDKRSGYLLDDKAELFKTRSGTKRWMRIETTGANVAVGMAFGDPRHGYLTDNTGRVLVTTDGGATWVRQYPFFDAQGKSEALVAASSRRNALLLIKDGNHLFATERAGRIGQSSRLTLDLSARRVSRGTVVRVTGRLTPATGVERVSVLARVVGADGGTRWVTQERTVSTTGSFTTSWRITAATEFIARWSGDASHDGDAAPRRVVRLGK